MKIFGKTLFGKTIMAGAALMVSSAAMANCPVELPVENLMECIVEEGGGGVYPTSQMMQIQKSRSAGEKHLYIRDDRSLAEIIKNS